MTTTRIPRPAVQMCVTATTVLSRGGSFVTATVESNTPTKDNKYDDLPRIAQRAVSREERTPQESGS